jgi:hypothetical protein
MGPSGPRSRRVSAILVGGDVAPWLSAKTHLKLWMNPWATFPLRCDVGGVTTIIERSENGAFTATAATTSTGELLGLSSDWPGPEPPFPRL